MDVSRRISHQKKGRSVSPTTVSETRPPEVYNTGDLASEDELGRIHYHGRIDWQVEFLQGDVKKVSWMCCIF